MASIEWQNIRVPKALHIRLTALAGEMLIAHEEGRSQLPSAYVEFVPLHHVITKALDELDGHKSRARQQSARKTRSARNATQSEAMYTPLTPDQETRS